MDTDPEKRNCIEGTSVGQGNCMAESRLGGTRSFRVIEAGAGRAGVQGPAQEHSGRSSYII
jgi:hypothetical protein